FVLLGLVVVIIGISSILAPLQVRYTESVDVDAPVQDVFDDIRLQERLMRWSVWPRETGSRCAVDPGPAGADGTEGARTVFVSKGRAVGHQRITRLVDGREIAMTLEGPGPPHDPALTFELEALEPSRTRVHLHFVNRFSRPFNAIWHFAGLSKWTRELHRKDLAGLKAFSEPPHVDADGREVGRVSTITNPYAVPLPESA
ncbi:MAG: SRPBCC family protein, partial [Myxococcota bacterium]